MASNLIPLKVGIRGLRCEDLALSPIGRHMRRLHPRLVMLQACTNNCLGFWIRDVTIVPNNTA